MICTFNPASEVQILVTIKIIYEQTLKEKKNTQMTLSKYQTGNPGKRDSVFISLMYPDCVGRTVL
jgi:hypothetical protein